MGTNLLSRALSNSGMIWVFLVLSAVICAVNIIVSLLQNGSGFPLDDAWIHQTYARSIAQNGTWSYSLNESSAGSTSPLWTLLLVPGFIFGKGNPFIWTFLISWLCLFGLVFVSIQTFDHLLPENRVEKLVFGAIMLLEWHLVWASGSGMETILFTFGVMAIFYLLLKRGNSFLIGLLVGLLACVRPDGITLIGPVLFVMFFDLIKKKVNIKTFLWLIPGLIAPLIVYGYHNYSLSGQLLPNTFFAKSAEYRELLSNPFPGRYLSLFTVLISGAGILLLPGFCRSIFSAIKNKDPWKAAGILWMFGFLLIYAIRLPVTYQHGRYLIPVIPIYLLLGFIGNTELLSLIKLQKQKAYKVIANGSLLLTSLIFLFGGIGSYSTDVKIINNLMVKPALWLHDHTAPGSVIAAHDIGAIGFFSERKIVDLAGLIDPAVVPILRDETLLAKYISNSGADYLVVFNDWYKKLGKSGSLLQEYSIKTGNIEKTVEIRSLP